jgi:hypothetical protein
VTTPFTPQIGDSVYLTSLFANIHIHGIISDLDTPDQVSASLEISGGNGLLSLAALQGPQGPAGTNAPLLKLQFQIFDTTDDLPTNLTTDEVDVGKYWIVREFDGDGNAISSKAWVWFGDHFEGFPMGTQGPVGPVPIVSFSIELLDPDGSTDSYVQQTGDAYHPSLKLWIKAPKGPTGDAGPIRDAADYDDAVAPVTGDVIKWNGTKYAPATDAPTVSKFWTYPEGHFTSVSLAIGTRVPIGSALIPPVDWDIVPYIQGHFRLTGVELDTTPFIIGVEVRLGNATSGQVVARGYGNITGYVDLIPHASTSVTPNDAITPDNGRGLIPAGSTGSAATLYVNAFNDGAAGLYNFDATGAQLSVLGIPV